MLNIDILGLLVPNVWTTITQLCSTAILFALMYKLAWKPVKKILDERSAYENEKLALANRLANENEVLQEQSRKTLAEAHQTAHEIVEEMGYEIIRTREPGGTPISEQIRNVILDKGNTAMDPRTEALLYAASRRQHLVEKVWPALKEGKIVICDRYLDSSLAYQGGARGLGIDNVLALNQFATDGFYPDLTLLFDLDPQVGLDRINSNANREVNRLDLEKLEFHNKVRNTFLDLAKRYPDRFVIIDASKSQEEVAKATLDTILARLCK